MGTPVVFIFIFICYAIMQINLWIYSNKQRRYYYYSLWQVEKVKSYFAKVRNSMTEMALNNQIDSEKKYKESIIKLAKDISEIEESIIKLVKDRN